MQRVIFDHWYRKYNYVLSIRCQQYELANLFYNNLCKRRAFGMWQSKEHDRRQQRDNSANEKLYERAMRFEAVHIYAQCFSRWKVLHILQARVHKTQKCHYRLEVQHKETSSTQFSPLSLLARLPLHGQSSNNSNCSSNTIPCMTRNLRASRLLVWWSLQHRYNLQQFTPFSKQLSCINSHIDNVNTDICYSKVKSRSWKDGDAHVECDNIDSRENNCTSFDKENNISPFCRRNSKANTHASCVNNKNNYDEDDEDEDEEEDKRTTNTKYSRYEHLDCHSMYGLVDTPTRTAR